MLKTKFLLFLCTLLLSFSSFAFVQCHAVNNAVTCLNLSGSTTAHYLKFEVGHFSSPVFCAASNNPFDRFQYTDNVDINQAMALNAFQVGQNKINYFQCNSERCDKKILIGEHQFNLTKDGQGNYSADPANYTLVIRSDYGLACH